MSDETALSYWFPLIKAAGLPVPRTSIIRMPPEAQEDVIGLFDGKEPSSALGAFRADLAKLTDAMGYPCFLRTDFTSAKHSWEESCFLPSADDIPRHIWSIVEHSEMAGLIGMPWDTWAVREFLPTKPLGVCPHFGNMPMCREFRFFVDDGTTRCFHPYWPMEALEQGGADGSFFEALSTLSADTEADLCRLAEAAGRAVGGSWSVDILDTERGWFVTDMAEADKSYHWPDCPHDRPKRLPRFSKDP